MLNYHNQYDVFIEIGFLNWQHFLLKKTAINIFKNNFENNMFKFIKQIREKLHKIQSDNELVMIFANVSFLQSNRFNFWLIFANNQKQFRISENFSTFKTFEQIIFFKSIRLWTIFDCFWKWFQLKNTIKRKFCVFLSFFNAKSIFSTFKLLKQFLCSWKFSKTFFSIRNKIKTTELWLQRNVSIMCK